MSAKMLRDRARRLDARVRCRRTIFFLALAANVLMDTFSHFYGSGRPSQWLGLADLATFLVWVYYWPYAAAGLHPFTTLSENLTRLPGVACYRAQLNALSDDYSTKLQMAAIIFAVAIRAALFPLWAMIGALGGMWIYYSRRRDTENTRRELQGLVEFEQGARNSIYENL